MIAENNPNINKAYTVLKELSQDEKAQRMYEAREKARRDEQSRLKSALKKGKIEGKIEIVKEMLKDGVDIKIISRYTNISIEDIQKITK